MLTIAIEQQFFSDVNHFDEAMMNLLISLIILLISLSEVFLLFTPKHILCNQSVEIPTLDLSTSADQNLSITLCNSTTWNVLLRANENFFARNASIDKIFRVASKRRFAFLGQIIDEEGSSVSVIVHPQLQIYVYLNGTYYYYLSLANNSSVTLKFSQQQLLHYYPLLVNDSVWRTLQQEEEIYQKNSIILRDLHFIYELLTLRCESDHAQYKTISFCSLALYIDQWLFERVFSSNAYHLFNYIEHFNFLLRSLTQHEYGGFLVKRLTLVDHTESNANVSFDILHQLSNNVSFPLKDYCLNHQMLLSETEKETHTLGYQSSIHTYDIGGICSSPFYMNDNRSEEINLNVGLSIFNEEITSNLSLHFNGLLKTSYLFLRQMGLNLTLCSINATRRGFFQFNAEISPAVANCLDLLPNTLQPALKRRAHLCFTHLNLNNLSYLPVKQEITCKQSIDLQSSVPVGGKHRKSPYIENALNSNRRSEWFEGNIVGMTLTFSLIIWIPVSCFVHFCVDEINKKALLEKQQQSPAAPAAQEMETLPIRTIVIEAPDSAKETQTDWILFCSCFFSRASDFGNVM